MHQSDLFVWDFWYHYDSESKLFHVIYLNADASLVPTNEHHFHARLGYAVTQDFDGIDWIDHDVFHADSHGWDNTSIWSGDVIKTADGFLLFYTSRNRSIDDGMTQNVGMARSTDFIHWDRIDGIRIEPDPRWYEPRNLEPDGDDTTHAWRDPFLFIHDGIAHMVLAAKSRESPICRKGAIAVLRAREDDLTDWEVLPPLCSPGWYSEMEVPQIYERPEGGLVLVFSTWARGDHAPTTNGQGGLHAINIDKIEPHDLGDIVPKVLLPASDGLYACRIIPELDGEIVGFDTERGGWRRSGRKTYLKSINREFG